MDRQTEVDVAAGIRSKDAMHLWPISGASGDWVQIMYPGMCMDKCVGL